MASAVPFTLIVPVVLMSPATVSGYAGVVVPIPTLPPEKYEIPLERNLIDAVTPL